MIHDNQAQPTGGWHAALAGAVLGTGLAGWWLAGDVVPTDASKEAVTVRPAPWAEQAQAARSTTRHAATQPAAAAAATAAAGPPPVKYVGQWMGGGRLAVVLSHQGRHVVVQVPGTVDGRYEVVSANDRELVLRDLASATTQRIALGATAATAAAAGTAAAPPPGETPGETTEETTTAVRVGPAKLPPPSKRTSDDLEPEN
jgi:hypothetical protein